MTLFGRLSNLFRQRPSRQDFPLTCMKKSKPPTPSKPKGRRRKTAPIQKDGPAINPRHHPDAAGIDVGAEEFVAALPPDRCEQTVRTFATYTSGVEALRDWFIEHGIKTPALESTGNYWIMLYDKLTEAGIDVYLVNARHVKGVPGKKTDVCDSQWLQQLHAAGLLRKSFRPALEIVPRRSVRLVAGAVPGQPGERGQSAQSQDPQSAKSTRTSIADGRIRAATNRVTDGATVAAVQRQAWQGRRHDCNGTQVGASDLRRDQEPAQLRRERSFQSHPSETRTAAPPPPTGGRRQLPAAA